MISASCPFHACHIGSMLLALTPWFKIHGRWFILALASSLSFKVTAVKAIYIIDSIFWKAPLWVDKVAIHHCIEISSLSFRTVAFRALVVKIWISVNISLVSASTIMPPIISRASGRNKTLHLTYPPACNMQSNQELSIVVPRIHCSNISNIIRRFYMGSWVWICSQ